MIVVFGEAAFNTELDPAHDCRDDGAELEVCELSSKPSAQERIHGDGKNVPARQCNDDDLRRTADTGSPYPC